MNLNYFIKGIMYKVYEEYLNTLYTDGKYRRLGILRQESNSELLDFSTNDYLNLSHHKDVIVAVEIQQAHVYYLGTANYLKNLKVLLQKIKRRILA